MKKHSDKKKLNTKLAVVHHHGRSSRYVCVTKCLPDLAKLVISTLFGSDELLSGSLIYLFSI